MKKVFFFLAMALISVFAAAQTSSNYNQVVWLNGKMMFVGSIPAIDSIIYNDDAAEQDTLHLLLPRTTVQVKHDTTYVYKHDTTYINTCEEDTKAPTFYVSADKQVSFAPGNLQYQASTKTWRFAENQYDYIGSDNDSISDTYEGWIDLFGWGTGDTPTNVGTAAKNFPTFVDWGTNTIGDDAPNTWRTLTSDEWKYLFMHTRWTIATVDSVLGFMLLSDDFKVPSDITMGIAGNGELSQTNVNFAKEFQTSNVYTADQFTQLRKAGCVFLPCAGRRFGDMRTMGAGDNGYYMSATLSSTSTSAKAFCLYFYNTHADVDGYDRYWGMSVRLVQDVK